MDYELKGWLLLLRYYLLTVVVFVVAKLVFMLCYSADYTFNMADIARVVGNGISLDLSTAIYFTLLPFLLTIVAVWMQGRKALNAVLTAYYAVVAVAFAMAFVADTTLYEFWKFKLDASCLQYLATPTEATASVSTWYVVARLLLTVVVAAVLFLLYRKVVGRIEGQTATARRRKIADTLFAVALLPLMIIGMRGGLGESTTNIGQVYFSQNQFLNHSAVNPVFSFLSSFEKTASNIPDYHFMADDECKAIVDSLFSTASVSPDTLLNSSRPHIVIILLESCGEQFASSMPKLQKLKEEGVYFANCYANSWRTDRGTLCTWSGYPSFPTTSVMKMPSKTRHLPSIASSLAKVGYTTTYLYGGDINFTNMRSYLMGTGFQNIVWQEDYTDEQQETAKWGVRDDITFRTVGDMLLSADSPQLIGYSTLSSHEPWDVPIHEKLLPVENAFYYLDQCIDSFVQRMKQSPQWDNLLIVMLADHGISYNLTEQDRGHNHIPLLWLGGALKSPRRIEAFCNQTDLPATLLGQLGIAHDDFTFSRDVMGKNYVNQCAVHTYNNGISVVDSTTFAVYDITPKRIIVGDTPRGKVLIHRGQAVLQQATETLKEMN